MTLTGNPVETYPSGHRYQICHTCCIFELFAAGNCLPDTRSGKNFCGSRFTVLIWLNSIKRSVFCLASRIPAARQARLYAPTQKMKGEHQKNQTEQNEQARNKTKNTT
jgi:hypothetical protein